MDFETLPNWFWCLYYLILMITIMLAGYSLVEYKFKFFSILVIVFSVTVPLYSLVNSITRARGVNEWEFFVQQVQERTPWAMYVLLGYIYIIAWWFFYLIKLRKT